MKNLCFLLFSLCFLAACGSNPEGKTLADGWESYGVEITADKAIDIATLEKKIKGKQSLKTKVKGDIDAVCLKKGCWMTLEKPNGDPMRVTFKEYGFFVPVDCAGKTAVVEGIAQFDTTSVADLRHYAEDEGLAAEEIAKITAPEIEMVFVADGVILK